VRRQGQSTDDAQDLTQGFFAHLLDKQTLRAADRERGHFRSFLLASLKHFLAKQWRRDAAQKRGGGRAPIALDFDDGETRYRIEPSHESTPEKLFERQWALTLLARALATLRSEFEASGKAARFASLKMYLGGEKSKVPYRELAGQLETREGAVKVAIHHAPALSSDPARGDPAHRRCRRRRRRRTSPIVRRRHAVSTPRSGATGCPVCNLPSRSGY